MDKKSWKLHHYAFLSVLGVYFLDGILDFQKLKEALEKTIADIPILSSTIQKKGEEYYCEEVKPSNVKITRKEVKTNFSTYYDLNMKNVQKNNIKIMDLEEAIALNKEIDCIEGGMTPVLNVPVLAVTYLVHSESNTSVLAISINHAIADAHGIVLLVETLEKHYLGMKKEKINPISFKTPDIFKIRSLSSLADFDIEKEKESVISQLTSFHPKRKTVVPEEKKGIIFTTKGTEVSIHFSKQRILELKEIVNIENKGKKFSSNDCVSAMILRIHTAITGIQQNEYVSFKMITNVRGRIKEVDENYFGNGVIFLNFEASGKEIMEGKYSDLVMKIRELVNSLTSEHVDLAVKCKSKFGYLNQGSFWKKTDLSLDDWRAVELRKPKFGKINCNRVILNPPNKQFYIPQVFYVTLAKDGGINVKMHIQEKNFDDSLLTYDLTTFEGIDKLYRCHQKTKTL